MRLIRILFFSAILLLAAAVVYAASFTESWNCADGDSITCDIAWTEVTGDADILTNRVINGLGGFAKNLFVATTALGSVNHYLGTTFADADNGVFVEFVLRYTNSSSPYYAITVDSGSDDVQWNYYADSTATAAAISVETAMTVANTDRVGVTIDGTGTSTVVRVWRNPTSTPATADNWDGDTTPDVTFTNDPASPVNTGDLVGFAIYQGGVGGVIVDAVAAGDFGAPPPASGAKRCLLLRVCN